MQPDSLLDRAIYSYGDVDRLVGLHAGTARRWLEGYERKGRYNDPVLRAQPSGSDSVTWGEMVEARMLAEFRDQRVPLARMRPAIEKLREQFGQYPLAHARPFLDVDGRELVQVVQQEVGLEKKSAAGRYAQRSVDLDCRGRTLQFHSAVCEQRGQLPVSGAAHP